MGKLGLSLKNWETYRYVGMWPKSWWRFVSIMCFARESASGDFFRFRVRLPIQNLQNLRTT